MKKRKKRRERIGCCKDRLEETRKRIIVSKVEEIGERKEWGASDMNGGGMGGANAEERRCSSANFHGGPSNICPHAAAHPV